MHDDCILAVPDSNKLEKQLLITFQVSELFANMIKARERTSYPFLPRSPGSWHSVTEQTRPQFCLMFSQDHWHIICASLLIILIPVNSCCPPLALDSHCPSLPCDSCCSPLALFVYFYLNWWLKDNPIFFHSLFNSLGNRNEEIISGILKFHGRWIGSAGVFVCSDRQNGRASCLVSLVSWLLTESRPGAAVTRQNTCSVIPPMSLTQGWASRVRPS